MTMDSIKKYNLEFINLQINVDCPLKCKNCYKSGEPYSNIDFTWAKSIIKEAARIGVKYINIIGGEPLIYNRLSEIIALGSDNGINSHIATSGINANPDLIDNLFQNGLKKLFISLDGSCEEINKISRNGYKYTLSILEFASKKYFDKIIILWVFNSINVYDFEKLLCLLTAMNIRKVCILKLKYYPGFDRSLIPTYKHIEYLLKIIHKYHNDFIFYPDICYRELMDSWFESNIKYELARCSAGMIRCSVNADSTFSPCPHYPYKEKFNSITDYLDNSQIIKKIRNDNNFYGCSI